MRPIVVLAALALWVGACSDSDPDLASDVTGVTTVPLTTSAPASATTATATTAASGTATSGTAAADTATTSGPAATAPVTSSGPATGDASERAPGNLLVAEPVAPPAGSAAAAAWRITYLSTSLDGEPVEVTGMVLAPQGEPPVAGRPVLAWAHGTTGMADRCAPSASGPAELATLLAPMLSAGYVVAATDYEGLGGPGLHPYMVGVSEGRSVLDIVRAARALPGAGAGSQTLVWGFSQGGHAALWAGQLASSYAPETDLLGVIASAPASLVGVDPIADPGGSEAIAGFLPMIVAGYAASYADVDPAAYLTPAAAARLDVIEQGCVQEVFERYSDLTAADMIRPRAWDPEAGTVTGPLGVRLVENEPGGSAIDAPVLIVQGSADTVVAPSGPTSIAERLCATGTVVDFRLYEGASHGSVNLASLPDVLAFAGQRLAGGEPTTTCG